MAEGNKFFERLTPIAEQSLAAIMLSSKDEKLVRDVSVRVLEEAGKMKVPAQQIIINQSDVKLLVLGAQEVLDAERKRGSLPGEA